LELCQAIAAERPGIKVLVMSGGLQELEHVYMKGMPFLQKPFSGTALRKFIKALLDPKPAFAAVIQLLFRIKMIHALWLRRAG
jgi:hypothetical protein